MRSDRTPLGQAKQMELVHKALKEWYQNNVLNVGGKYYLGDLKQARSIAGTDPKKDQIFKDARGRFNNLLASPGVMSQVKGITEPFKPRDLTDKIDPGEAITPSVIDTYNPLRGDKVFTVEETKAYAELFDAGETSPALASVAQQLGRSPLALLNQQLRAYGLDPKPIRLGPASGGPSIDKSGRQNYSSLKAGAEAQLDFCPWCCLLGRKHHG